MFAAQSVQEQQELAQLFSDNIKSQEWNGATLQQEQQFCTFIAALPGATRNVRILYGVGHPCDVPEFEGTAIADKMAMLYLDFRGEEPPPVMTLSTEALLPREVKRMSRPAFESVRKGTRAESCSLQYFGKTKDATLSVELPDFVPVPAYLVYDR